MVDGVCDGFGDIFRLVHKCQLPMVHGVDLRQVSWIQFCLQCCQTGFHKSHVAVTPVSERVTDSFRFSIFISDCWGYRRDVWKVVESGWGRSWGCLGGCLEDVIMLSFQSYQLYQSFQFLQSSNPSNPSNPTNPANSTNSANPSNPYFVILFPKTPYFRVQCQISVCFVQLNFYRRFIAFIFVLHRALQGGKQGGGYSLLPVEIDTGWGGYKDEGEEDIRMGNWGWWWPLTMTMI